MSSQVHQPETTQYCVLKSILDANMSYQEYRYMQT